MKKALALLCILPLYATYEPLNWTFTVLHNTTPEEQTIIANFLYWAYARSSSAVDTQEAYLSYLNDCLATGRDIAATRLNPAHKPPHERPAETILRNAQIYSDTLSLHKAIQKTYCHCLNETLAPGTLYEYPRGLVEELRTQARKTSAEAINSYIPTMKTYLSSLHEFAHTTGTILDTYQLPQGQKSLLDTVWQWLAPSLLESFISFEHKTNRLYQVWGDGFYTAHYMNEMLWVHIEQARAQLYASYYRSFCEQCRYTLYHAFNEQGFIPRHERAYLLPAL